MEKLPISIFLLSVWPVMLLVYPINSLSVMSLDLSIVFNFSYFDFQFDFCIAKRSDWFGDSNHRVSY